MTTQEQAAMHQQHREAESELISWLDDIYMWRAEHKQALAWLAQMQAAIHENDMQLQQHYSAVDKQERHIRQHEHEIAMQEQTKKYDESTPLVEQHAEFNENQKRINTEHGRLGERHRSQMAALKRVLDQLVA